MQSYDDLVLQAVAGATPTGNGWLRGACPFCALVKYSEGRNGNFVVNPGTGGYYCHRCGTKGFLKEKPDGWGHLVLSGRPSRVRSVAQVGQTIEPPENFYCLGCEPAWSSHWAEEAISYCVGRGISEELLWEARIGMCHPPEDFRLRKRVIIPIFGADGVSWVGYVGRHWYKDKQDPLPYLYSDDLDRQSTVYNAQALLVETEVPAFLVEGVPDGLALWPDGIPLLGTYSDYQVWMLLQARRPLVVVLDGDAHDLAMGLALRLALECRCELAGYDYCGIHNPHSLGKIGCLRLPAGADPDEIPASWMYQQAYQSLCQGIL